MSKAVLVLDMAERCSQCIFRRDAEEGYSFCGVPGKGFDYQVNDWMMSRTIGKPDWCPLRELPEKPDYPAINESSYIAGWNDCLDAITGGVA